jgi:hypothetical protein
MGTGYRGLAVLAYADAMADIFSAFLATNG